LRLLLRTGDTVTHDFTTCECTVCHAALFDLQAELDELERTDPDVKAAAESYDAMVRRVTGRGR
jgi:hypothetical protein